jgi:hypothetical protein
MEIFIKEEFKNTIFLKKAASFYNKFRFLFQNA